MALQLAPQQKTYDQLLPFYCGDLQGPFDIAKVGTILVQIKYRQQTTSPTNVLNEDFFSPNATPKSRPHRRSFKHMIVNDPGARLLFILFDLGSERNSVEVTYSRAPNPTLWAIHSKGHSEEDFGCSSEMGVQQCVERFFYDMKSFTKGDIAFGHDQDMLDNVLNHDTIRLGSEEDGGDVSMRDVDA